MSSPLRKSRALAAHTSSHARNRIRSPPPSSEPADANPAVSARGAFRRRWPTIGCRLRASGENAQALTLTVAYADHTQTTRSRPLTEATAGSPVLAATARELPTGLGLQRARVHALTLRADRLLPADETVHKLTFDDRDDKLCLETAFGQAATRHRLDIAGAASALPRTR
ncbi:hypothetical protein [Streptomyces sp. NPDC102282]|uniref:DinB/UmuC family translesion DNA polymerase n=1 Tax=Streptomyces sp. NPDC102282 TaxID=3366154 RepID=UPI0038082C2E